MAFLRWTSEALGRLEDSALYIAQDNPTTTKNQIARLPDRAAQLDVAPRSVRTVPAYQDEDVREIHQTPYCIICYLNGDCIEILSMMHYRRLLPRKRDLLRSRPVPHILRDEIGSGLCHPL